jgi:ribose 5-phosphate isomerase B
VTGQRRVIFGPQVAMGDDPATICHADTRPRPDPHFSIMLAHLPAFVQPCGLPPLCIFLTKNKMVRLTLVSGHGVPAMRIAVGSDHRGTQLRGQLVAFLNQLGQEVIDLGSNSQDDVDYPDIAEAVARKVGSREVDRGILICGTGLGMCIVANKVPGVRAAPCHDDVTAELSRRHNDLNVLCLSGDILGERLADRLVEIWLSTPFEGGRHARRNRKITEIERRNGHQNGKK